MSIDAVLARVVFRVGETDWTWSDVVEAAQAWGAWDEVERRLADRARRGGRRSRREVEAIAEAHRYERDLLAVDDTRRWFEGWGITLEEWLAHLGGRVVGEGRGDPALPVWVEAVTSGVLERVARRLASGLAAHHALGGQPARPAIADVDRSLARFTVAASPKRPEVMVDDRRLAWTTFLLQVLTVPDEGAAQEVVHSVHEGRTLGEMAGAVGLPLVERTLVFESAPPELQTRLSASATGDLIGPFPSDGSWQVVSVLARAEPRADDPAVVRLACERAVEQALAREVARRVRWVDPVMVEAR